MTADNEPDSPATETFWQSRESLTRIRDFARARRAGPWATLGVALGRVVAATEPNVMLPPLIGQAVSLNLFIALVGRSGGGKGAAEGAARDALRIVDYNDRTVTIDEFPLGSGEGIARTFRPAGSDDDEPCERTRALFTVPEVDTLAALGSRQGSTLMPELRKVYMGEQAGFNNASKATRSTLDAHSYRAALVVGVQPVKAGPLLHDADGGTPQRFVWLPVDDPDAPDIAPPEPQPWTVKVSRWGAGLHELKVPEIACAAIDRNRLASLRNEPVDPLDGHRMLAQLKVAAGLMLLDGRTIVDDDDWHLAGLVMRASHRTRNGIEATIAERTRAANLARARADGERAVIIDDAKHVGETRRAREGVIRYITRRGRSSLRDVAKSLKSDIRPHCDEVLAELIDTGLIVETTDGSRQFYELAEPPEVGDVGDGVGDRRKTA